MVAQQVLWRGCISALQLLYCSWTAVTEISTCHITTIHLKSPAQWLAGGRSEGPWWSWPSSQATHREKYHTRTAVRCRRSQHLLFSAGDGGCASVYTLATIPVLQSTAPLSSAAASAAAELQTPADGPRKTLKAGEMFHEKQYLMHCAVHTLNNLFQESWVTAALMDDIANEL